MWARVHKQTTILIKMQPFHLKVILLTIYHNKIIKSIRNSVRNEPASTFPNTEFSVSQNIWKLSDLLNWLLLISFATYLLKYPFW